MSTLVSSIHSSIKMQILYYSANLFQRYLHIIYFLSCLYSNCCHYFSYKYFPLLEFYISFMSKDLCLVYYELILHYCY